MNLIVVSGSKAPQRESSRRRCCNMQHPHWGNFSALVMSEEEQKIRQELEEEIERNLVKEIKDSICQLALRLHKLKQHKKDPSPSRSCVNLQSRSKDDMVTKVKVTITTTGECNFATYESNSRPHSSRSEPRCGKVHSKIKQYDWSKASDSRPSSAMTTIQNCQSLDPVSKYKRQNNSHARSRQTERRKQKKVSSIQGKVLVWKY